MEAQKRRTNNFSCDEKRILTELVLKYQEIIENKRTDATTNSAKMRGWMRLAEEFNTVSTYCNRTHTVLKCCWENIKRQTKKDRADRKKKLFMTGGGKPPSPPPSNRETGAIVEAILGPALEGIPNIYDSAAGAVINEIIELNSPVEKVYVIRDDAENVGISKQNNENIETGVLLVSDEKKAEIENILLENAQASTSKSILKVNNENDWSSWTPKNLKTPVSNPLRVPKENEEDWLKRRRPRSNDSLGDTLIKEKIKLVKILQENAEKESLIRLAILEEQLKQEKIKTQKLTDN